MKEKFTNIMNKFAAISSKFANLSVIKAISDGMMMSLPVIIIGSIFLLLQSIPIEAYTNFINKMGWASLLMIPYKCTMGIIGVIVAYGVGKSYTDAKGYDGVSAGILSIAGFFSLIPMGMTTDEVSAFPTTYLGISGMFTGIIVGLVAGIIFSFMQKKNITIKMPAGVPEMAGKAFSALIPGVAIMFVFMVINGLCQQTQWGSFPALVAGLIQAPLMGLGNSLWVILLIYLLSNLVWFTGIHGVVITSIFNPVLYGLDLANLDAVAAGHAATNMFGKNFTSVYGGMSGAGITIGLVLLMLFRAKSQRYKTLGKVAIAPSIFCINEPVIFGVPIMFNIVMIIPFVILPLVSLTIAGLLTQAGILPILSGAQIPWSTPAVLIGGMLGGWKVALYQVFMIILSVLVYYPFFKIIDKKAYEEEQEAADVE